MDDGATQLERQHTRKRRRALALLVGVGFLISFFLGFGLNWAVRILSEPSVYCLDHKELSAGRYKLYADRSGCTPGEVCLLTTIGIVSQPLRATDCRGSSDRGS
jgi:hypothetical protein